MVCNEQISRGIEFQMVVAEQRNEREPKLMLDGVGKSLGDSAGRRSGWRNNEQLQLERRRLQMQVDRLSFVMITKHDGDTTSTTRTAGNGRIRNSPIELLDL